MISNILLVYRFSKTVIKTLSAPYNFICGFPIPKIITLHNIKIVAIKNKGTINILILLLISSFFLFNNNVGYSIYFIVYEGF